MTTISSNDLDKQLYKLKEILNFPRIYLCNYFADLKTEIDLSFAKKQQNSSNAEIMQILHENYKQMIDKVNSIEEHCLKIQKQTFNDELTHETNSIIKQIENKLNITTDEYLSKEINDLLYEQTLKLERVIFQNRTLIFLDRSKCCHFIDDFNDNEEERNLFDEMDPNTTVGKLVCVYNEYFGYLATEILKK